MTETARDRHWAVHSPCCWALALMRATSVLAAGVVGDGTPESCTEAALDTTLAGGGTVTFNCGGTATITVTSRVEPEVERG